MKTKTIKLYSINELSEEAQEKAHFDYLHSFEYFGNDENQKSLKKFEEIFPIKVKDWEYGYRSYIDFFFQDEFYHNQDSLANLSGQRLAKYLWNNYKDKIYSKKYYSTAGYYDNDKKYHYKYRHSSFQIESDNCPLTGYYMDNEILDPIWKFIDRPDNRNFEEIMSDCLHNWIRACNNDYEYQKSMESFIEKSEINEWTYQENGKFEIE